VRGTLDQAMMVAVIRKISMKMTT